MIVTLYYSVGLPVCQDLISQLLKILLLILCAYKTPLLFKTQHCESNIVTCNHVIMQIIFDNKMK